MSVSRADIAEELIRTIADILVQATSRDEALDDIHQTLVNEQVILNGPKETWVDAHWTAERASHYISGDRVVEFAVIGAMADAYVASIADTYKQIMADALYECDECGELYNEATGGEATSPAKMADGRRYRVPPIHTQPTTCKGNNEMIYELDIDRRYHNEKATK